MKQSIIKINTVINSSTQCDELENSSTAIYITIFILDTYDVEIRNLVDIRQQMNYELSMRVTTEVNNDDIFYTDLNGFQVMTINPGMTYY